MKFYLLDPTLKSTADKAVKFFRSQKNLKSFRAKRHPFGEDGWAPTFIGVNDEKISVCVEVSDNPYPTTLDAFILNCKNNGYPVQCYVVMPRDSNHAEFKERLKKAQENGVGVMDIDNHSRPHSYCEALTLSLTGLRNEIQKFPQTLKPKITTAMNTFRNGNPAKGCSDIYDDIEALTRRLGKYADANNWWKPSTHLPVNINFDTQNWNVLLNFYLQNLDFQNKVKPICVSLDRQLVQRIVGITTYRNQTGHKPKSIQETMDRDSKLKTRFETAVDLLLELVQAIDPIHIV